MSVYTTVTTEDLSPFLAQYAIGELVDLQGISAGMENTNYFLDTTKGRYVLTLYEAHSKEDLPYFLNLMQHLSAHQVETITPIADQQGALFNHLCGKPAAVIQRLKGEALQQNEVTVQHCQLIGDALARFHLAGLSYQGYRENEDRNYHLSTVSSQIIARLLLALPETDQQLLRDELEYHVNIAWDEFPSGVTHSDLFCDNAVFYYENGQPILSGIIDLYLSCHDAFIYDLAIVANDWCGDKNHHLDPERYLALLSAYNKVRPLEENEKQAWTAMLRSAALRFWVFRLENKLNPPAGEMVLCKDPDAYKHKLQACLEDQQKIKQAINSL